MAQLWPIAHEREEAMNPPELFDLYDQATEGLSCQDGDRYQATLLDTAQHMFDAETNRRDGVETRAGVVVGAAGLLGSLVIGAGQLAITRSPPRLGLVGWIMVVFYVLSLAYFTVAIVAALAAQGSTGAIRGNILDPSDLPPASPNPTRQRGSLRPTAGQDPTPVHHQELQAGQPADQPPSRRAALPPQRHRRRSRCRSAGSLGDQVGRRSGHQCPLRLVRVALVMARFLHSQGQCPLWQSTLAIKWGAGKTATDPVDWRPS